MDMTSITSRTRHNTVLVAVILVAVTSAGLAVVDSGGDQPNDTTDNDPSFNRADIMFMGMMIIHHDQAIEMAELATNRTTDDNVLALAQNISEAQREENKKMADWLRELGYNRPRDGHRMAGMASEAEMDQLRNSTGEEFDQLFARLMIAHHRGGIQMAQSFADRGRNQDLIELQEQMIATQQQEIDLMQDWGLASQ